jgi:hypothetical protein
MAQHEAIIAPIDGIIGDWRCVWSGMSEAVCQKQESECAAYAVGYCFPASEKYGNRLGNHPSEKLPTGGQHGGRGCAPSLYCGIVRKALACSDWLSLRSRTQGISQGSSDAGMPAPCPPAHTRRRLVRSPVDIRDGLQVSGLFAKTAASPVRRPARRLAPQRRRPERELVRP